MKRRHFNVSTLAIAATSLTHGPLVRAQGKPLRIIVGFPAGGSSDALARFLAEALRGKFDGPVIVENRAGAGGRIAAESLKTADADGSVMLLTPNVAVTLYPHIYKRLGYDATKDLSPVARLATFPLVIGVGPAVPASVKSMADLMAWFKANPASAFYGSSAPGSTPHFVGQMVGKAAGVPLTHVAYKGDAPAVQDLLGGQVPMSIHPPAALLPHLPAGRLRVLATTGARRMERLPETPTLLESGFKIQTADWFGTFVPGGTPNAAVQRLQLALKEALVSREVRDGLAKLQLSEDFVPQPEFGRQIREEFDYWGPIVRSSGFSIDE